MNLEAFTPIASLVGGLLIGLSAAILLIFNGRIAGISGIFANALFSRESGASGRWRWFFIAGLLAGGLALFPLLPSYFAVTHGRSLWMIAVAGVLVGVGTRFGSGCTSGHGVCGMSRFSRRSIVATLTFVASGALTVFLLRVLGVTP